MVTVSELVSCSLGTLFLLTIIRHACPSAQDLSLGATRQGKRHACNVGVGDVRGWGCSYRQEMVAC